MSKRAVNPPPLILHSVPNPGDDSYQADNSTDQDTPRRSDFLRPVAAGSNLTSQRESNSSDAQYAVAPAPTQYLDLPSTVPFQQHFQLTPALPSADFPSSARDFVSPPGTSSTTAFPTPSPSVDPSVASYYYTSPEDPRLSNASVTSDQSERRADQNANPATSASAALSRADSLASYNSAWTGEGSEQHLTLDIAQFPRPPQTETSLPEESPQSRTSGSFINFGPYRQPTSTKPPISPLFEESEPSGSRPLTPVSGTPNYQYPVSEESKSSVEELARPVINEQPRPRLQSDAASLLPPSPLPTTGHLSYQSHATAASRGSTVPRFSVEGLPATPPVTHQWARVMDTKSDWEASKSIIPSLKAESEVSLASVQVIVSSGSDDNDKSVVSTSVSAKPPSNTLSPFSVESNSDIYSAIGRMSFPKPPGTANSATDPSSPVSTAPPRSNWVTGVSLKTKGSRGSLKRKVEESPIASPLTPSVPPLPSIAGAASSSPMLQFSSASDEDVQYDSSTKESGSPTGGLTIPSESRASTISELAPSYDRRVSDLLRAAAELPKRDSTMSSQTDTTESIRDSVEGAVLGVARTASLTARAKALLRQPASIVSTGQEPSTLSYLVPSPHQSALPSEQSLARGTPEAQTPQANMLATPTAPLQRSAYMQNYGMFPESVQSQSIEGGDEISLRRFYSSDVPNSALPLNQSTPFQSSFYQSASPSAYRGPADNMKFISEVTESDLHRSNSKSSKRSRRGSVLSSITKASSRAAKTFSWLTRKSLPPIPRSPPRVGHEKGLPNPDDDLTVPELAKRAAMMDQYLSVGELPYSSPTSSPYLAPHAYNSVHYTQRPIGRMSLQSVLSTFSNRERAERIERERRFAGNSGFVSLPETRPESNFRSRVSLGSTLSLHRKKVAVFVLIVVVVIAVAIPVGVVLGKKAQHRSGVALCAGGVMTGASCQLNSTCVCTSDVQGTCNAVAQSLLDLLPSANGLFGMNLTKSDLALTLWDLKGEPMGNCADQAILVDVSPALNQSSSPNRTEWARTAVLYNLVLTEDLVATETFRSSIAKADFNILGGSDASITDDSKRIAFQASGYVYDLSAMKFAPSAVSWTSDSGVDQSQIAKVGNTASNALDRMYSFATASSIQRSTALTRYWTTVLGLSESSLPNFISALSKAAVLLPYDAMSNSTATFLSENQQRDGISFPPPVACLPAVPTTGRQNLGVIEQNAFGLPQLGDAPGTLDSSCFPDHPVWGVLDVLRLRRSFDDSRPTMRIPTTDLISDAASRVILHAGEQLVGLTSPEDDGIALQGNFDILAGDPRNYGTLQHINHVALSYLQSIPNIQLAAKVAQYISSTNEDSTPAAPGGSLFTSADVLSSMPIIEVAVFGSIFSTDVQESRADFATPDGGLFFGSQQGDIFRKWALRNLDDSILWSNSSTAPQVVHETATTNSALENIWQEATGLINNATAIGRGTSAAEISVIVSALTDASLFSSS